MPALGTLDVSFYRDDFERIGLHPQVKPSDIPFEVEGRHIVLVDDVLYTGRTIRAALNELFDYGRPESVRLAALVDRGGRELPIVRAVRRCRRCTWGRVSTSRSSKTTQPAHAGHAAPAATDIALSRMQRNPQLNSHGELQHLLTTEGLPAAILRQILDTALPFVSVTEREVKKIPLLRGKSIFNLFFEPSTRTRTTFEIAAKRLSADVVNLNIGTSSQSKGETLLDTVANLSAMHADMFIVRHAESGAAAPHRAPCGARHPRHQRRRRPPRAPDAGACSTCSRSATTRTTSRGCAWRSSATSCIRAWRARRSTR